MVRKITKKVFPLPLLSDLEAKIIVTSNGYGENKCCKNGPNCFLNKLTIDQAVNVLKRYEASLFSIQNGLTSVHSCREEIRNVESSKALRDKLREKVAACVIGIHPGIVIYILYNVDMIFIL